MNTVYMDYGALSALWGHRAVFVFAIRGRIEAPNTQDRKTVDTGTQLETQPGACKLQPNNK